MQRKHSKEIEDMSITLEDVINEIYNEQDALHCTFKILKFYSLFEAFTHAILQELVNNTKE